MPLSSRSCKTGSSVDERCTSMACVITSSPTRLMIWSTFSTATRMVLLDEAAAGPLGAAGLAGVTGSVAADSEGTGSTAAGSGAAGADGGALTLTAKTAARKARRVPLTLSELTLKKPNIGRTSGREGEYQTRKQPRCVR